MVCCVVIGCEDPLTLDMKAFLRAAKASLLQHAKPDPAVTTATAKSYCFVMGNEGGDMDSTVCAILTAYRLQCLHDDVHATPGHKLPAMFGSLVAPIQFVPLINYAEEDLSIRRDVELATKFWDRYFFQSLEHLNAVKAQLASRDPKTPHYEDSLELSDLVFLKEKDTVDVGAEKQFSLAGLVKPADPASSKTYGMFVVDHNLLCLEQQPLNPLVLGVVDHHEDCGVYKGDLAAGATEHRFVSTDKLSAALTANFENFERLRMIQVPCGSASSLVALLYRDWTKQHAAGSASSCACASEKVSLQPLLCTILLDTANFNVDAKKTTKHDMEATEYIIKRMIEQRQHDSAAVAGTGITAEMLQEALTAAKATEVAGADPAAVLNEKSAIYRKLFNPAFKIIQAARHDASFPPVQCLRRDFKKFVYNLAADKNQLMYPTEAAKAHEFAVGIPAWLELHDVLYARLTAQEMDSDCLDYCLKLNMDSLCVAFNSAVTVQEIKDGKPHDVQVKKRELQIFIPYNPADAAAVARAETLKGLWTTFASAFKPAESVKMELKKPVWEAEIPATASRVAMKGWWMLFEQGNASISRKQLEPMMKEFWTIPAGAASA